MERRDWPTARDFLSKVTDRDDHAFYVSICADVSGVQEWIGQWVAAEPQSTLPLLVQGAHGVFWAWEARGSAYAEHTQQEQFDLFFKRLTFAENCLDDVADRDPYDTTARAFLLNSGIGRQVDLAEQQRRFSEVVKRHPQHKWAHGAMQQYLCEKWFGSHDQMFAFAREISRYAPPGSPLHGAIAEAYIEKYLDLSRTGGGSAYMEQPEVGAELTAAAERSVFHPAFQRRPGWPRLFNSFAFALHLSDQYQAAYRVYQIIGDDYITEHPWDYYNSDRPVDYFLSLRQPLYAWIEAQ
ncbi:hypothetical protein Prum_044030 [Phytohabitans rumicis]|uniref:DUF4034 domain-containing protein n=1 Tax=Phytohabitans rumicis TaxID=1076125 RepID=A0A6V8L7G7_9ACTN|nr:hypothetical protein Prum_044030 [Phytohabitans rumicis]